MVDIYLLDGCAAARCIWSSATDCCTNPGSNLYSYSPWSGEYSNLDTLGQSYKFCLQTVVQVPLFDTLMDILRVILGNILLLYVMLTAL
jgi:hypothetical protein